jgi:photosystem II stability/assembly factor-like uncharacterized protein
MNIMRPALALAAALAAVPAPAQDEVAFDSATLAGLRARSIGPATMSGRVASIDVAPTEPATIYVGSASGGVWRSRNNGTTFAPVFDKHTQSIGAVRVDPNDPMTVWVGTGESRVRNSVAIGTGVYVSRDGGENWTDKGLDETRHIANLLVHPDNGQRIWVCATGNAFADSAERGVYRSDDGGDSWTRTLFVDEGTGCADLEMDPSNPQVLYAAMWDFRREPDFFRSGGPGSGLYKSTDGGGSWTRLEQGLPQTDLGRLSLAVAPSEPSRVYALVEAETTGIYRSDDAGASWRLMNTSAGVQFRPFYFGELVVDPVDADRVYRPGYLLVSSEDGAKTFGGMFSGVGGSIHPDHHWLWINPTDPTHLIIGTDGGVYVSHNRGVHWRFVASLPLSQFYHVSADMAVPYNVYGGLQDNGSWVGPSHRTGAIRNKHWESVGYGDGFWVFADPTDPDIVFSEYQGGKLLRVDRRTNEVKMIAPAAGPGEAKLRFNWNTPIHLSPSRPGILYYGSQFLHRSDDRGESWTRISPDLTSNDPKRQRQAQTGGITIDNSTAENNTTIYTISESPVDPQTIWVGTDDGLVQVTRNGGGSWRNVTANIDGLPEGLWVSRVEASPHQAGTAFVTVDGHRSGDNGVYVYETRDHGATWRSLASADIEGYAWVVKQDPVAPGLLYLGTEFGLYISLDGGARWARFSENLPKVAVHDLFIHPRDHDLIVGTHGRGVYIIDDLTPLRALTGANMAAEAALLPSRPQAMWSGGALQEFGGNDEFYGEPRSESAVIAYHLKKRHMFGDLRVNIYDADGTRITSLAGGKRRGMNRVDWPMRLKAPRLPPSTQLVPAFAGPRLPEGRYRVELVRGEEVLESSIELVADPRTPHSVADRQLQQRTALAIYADLADLTYLAESLADLRQQALARAEAVPARKRALDRFAGGLAGFLEALSASRQGMITGEEKLREEYGQLYGAVVGFDGAPTQTQLGSHRRLRAQLDQAIAQADAYLAAELPALNRALEGDGQPPLTRIDRAEFDAQADGAGGSSAALGKHDVRRLPETLRILFGAQR